MTDEILYFDHAATTPARPQVMAAMNRWLERRAGNASSTHGPGRAARAALEEARERVATAIGASPREIYFTSGGTESDNLALLGRWRSTRRGVVISAVEHSGVREPASVAAREGADLTVVGVDEAGRLDLGALEEALEGEPGVVSVMWANNETGAIQPVERIGTACAERDVVFHTDAVQAVGHIPVDVNAARCALLSMSAHKLGGPQGVGAVYVRQGTALEPLLSGGGHERGLRPGTSNVAGAIGLAMALELATAELETERTRLEALRDGLQARLLSAIPDLHVNAGATERLPHILSIGMDGIPADVLVASLDLAGLAVSSGSACRSGGGEPSHVLVAMGRSTDAVVRFSLGWSTTAEEVERGAGLFLDIVERTRAAVA